MSTPPQASPASENRLAHETSPYLLQHKDNPVAWWAWGPEALAEAKQANKQLPERRAPARDDNVVDLMAALKAAVAQTNGSRRNGNGAAKASKPASATATPRSARQPAQRRKAS